MTVQEQKIGLAGPEESRTTETIRALEDVQLADLHRLAERTGGSFFYDQGLQLASVYYQTLRASLGFGINPRTHRVRSGYFSHSKGAFQEFQLNDAALILDSKSARFVLSQKDIDESGDPITIITISSEKASKERRLWGNNDAEKEPQIAEALDVIRGSAS